MMIDICKLFILLLLNSSCITHKEQLQSNAEISLRTTLQEVNADSGLVMLMDSAGNVIAKSSLSLLNGKSLEEEVYTTVRDMGTLAVPVSLIPVLEKGNVSLSDTVNVGNGIYNHNGKEIRDHNADMGGYGEITLQQAILFDSKVGVTKSLSPYMTIKTDYSPMEILNFYHSFAVSDYSICSAKTMKEIQQTFEMVVSEGTGKPLFSDNVKIAGKTGSVIKEDGKHEVSFCGYFKVNNAVYTCLVIISNPKNGYPSGGIMAGNVIKEIVNRLNNK